MPDTDTIAKATPKQVQAFFGEDMPVTTKELMALKKSNAGKDYEQIATGIGSGTLTY